MKKGYCFLPERRAILSKGVQEECELRVAVGYKSTIPFFFF